MAQAPGQQLHWWHEEPGCKDLSCSNASACSTAAAGKNSPGNIAPALASNGTNFTQRLGNHYVVAETCWGLGSDVVIAFLGSRCCRHRYNKRRSSRDVPSSDNENLGLMAAATV